MAGHILPSHGEQSCRSMWLYSTATQAQLGSPIHTVPHNHPCPSTKPPETHLTPHQLPLDASPWPWSPSSCPTITVDTGHRGDTWDGGTQTTHWDTGKRRDHTTPSLRHGFEEEGDRKTPISTHRGWLKGRGPVTPLFAPSGNRGHGGKGVRGFPAVGPSRWGAGTEGWGGGLV